MFAPNQDGDGVKVQKVIVVQSNGLAEKQVGKQVGAQLVKGRKVQLLFS
jgi:hypothetical protein